MKGNSIINRLIVLALCILIISPAYSQNLIENPSFEQVGKVDNRWSGTYTFFNKKIIGWNSPTQGSPDMLFINFLDRMFPPRPNINLKDYTPRTGKFMVGIKVYGCRASTQHCKEYLQAKLRAPLKTGEQYYYEYWVRPVSSSVKVNSFGIGLSTEEVQQPLTVGYLKMNPVYTVEERIDNDSVWHKISGVFEADSLYNYIVIGNFGLDDSMDARVEENGIDYGFYLIDDVLLWPVNVKIIPEEAIILEDILFAFDKAELLESVDPQLDNIATYLQNNPGATLQINGHTDSQGTESHNLDLSKRRAAAVKKYLLAKGISKTRMATTGYGSSQPLVPNDTEENRERNRRVEVVIED